MRVDNDAVNVRWEVICEDEDQTKPNVVSSSGTVKAKRENVNDTSQSVDVGKLSSLINIFLEDPYIINILIDYLLQS